jgi:hypothetical protein
MKAILGAIGAVVVVAALYYGYVLMSARSAARQWDNAKEISLEEITKDGQTWNVKFESVLDRPIDQVWEAFGQPQRSAEFIPDTFKKSELKSSAGNKKVLEMQVQVLTLPLQTFVTEMTYDEPGKTVGVKTLQGPQDLTATYVLEPSPDGKKTLIRYTSTAVNKINVPLPESVQRGAVKELFVKQIRAINAGIEDELKKRGEKPAA